MCDVNIATGEVSQFSVDFFLPGIIPLHFIRTYSSSFRDVGPLGYGWKHNLDVSLRLTNNRLVFYNDNGQGTEFDTPAVGREIADAVSGLVIKRTENEIILTEADLNKLIFPHSIQFGGRWRLGQKEDPYGNTIRFYYNEAGLLNKIIDTNERSLAFHYGIRNHLTDIRISSDANSQNSKSLLTYKYDGNGDLIGVIDRTGVPCIYVYEDHLLTQVTNRLGGHLYYQYDRNRRCVRAWRDSGVQYRELRYHDTRKIVVVMESRGYMTIYRNNDKGLTEQEIDPLGRVKSDVYDAEGNVIVNSSESGAIQQVTSYDQKNRTLIVAQNGGETTFELNEAGKPVSITNAEGHTNKYEYDHGGSVTKMISPLGAEWSFKYDDHGYLISAIDHRGYEVRKKRTKERVTTIEDDLGIISKTWFDIWGNAIVLEDALGRRTELGYDSAGQLTKVKYPDGSAANYVYDGEGNLLRVAAETGLVTQYRYDLNGSLLEIIEPGDRRMVFEYDTEENLITIKNFKGEKAALTYDGVGRATQITYFDGRVECFEYDDRDNVIAVINGVGDRLVEFEYDDASRLVKKKYADGSEVKVTYGAQNQILSIENSNILLQYEWDADMNIVKEQIGDDVTLEFEYDKSGNRIALKSSKGRQITYEWDQRGRLTKIADSGKFIYEYSYNLLDLIAECKLPNGLVQSFAYDRLNRLIQRRVLTSNGAELTERSFQYDTADRLITMNDRQRGAFEYQYDNREHVLNVLRDKNVIEHYEYDDNENLLLTSNGSRITVGLGNRVARAGNENYQYDNEGNLIVKRVDSEVTHYEYRGEGELISVVHPNGDKTEYRYDPLGRRIAKVHAELRTDYLWDGVALLEEVKDQNGSLQYLFMPGSFFPAGLTLDGEHYSYSIDQLGTPTELFNNDGAIAWAVEQTAFGEIRRELKADIKNPFRFQGQYFDEELGLCYTRHRYYNPILGRFTTQDPIGFEGGPNLYQYVPNPINWIDPFGLVVCEVQMKCSWSDKQKEEARKKVDEMNKKIGTGVKIPNKVPSACAARKNAKKIYEDCQKQGHKLPDLKETGSKCSNQQADHILEVVAGGAESGKEGCKNLQPLNQSVNASFGSQMANCAKKNAGKMLDGIRFVKNPEKNCRPGGKKCPNV